VRLVHQSMYYPVTDDAMDTGSFEQFAESYFPTAKAMAWAWEARNLLGAARNVTLRDSTASNVAGNGVATTRKKYHQRRRPRRSLRTTSGRDG
jgi:hypothetical protein